MIKNKNNKFSDLDAKLWDSVSSKAKKYKKPNRIILSREKEIIKPIKKDVIIDNKRKEIIKKIKIKKETISVETENKLEGLDPKTIPAGISLKQAQDLKKGKLRPEKIYDLHGYTQFRAHNYLNDEIIKCYKKNIRSLLIITGKKLGASGAEGVLKREVPKWLNLSPLREIILMTSWATPRDGGEGALYVLLKRHKEINN